ncbi:UNVERIFIED_CONTAM: hypothetical protein PYX00_003869 [Menopon gallinae]|uniref:UDP-N-acetylglucosamine diphosphorylase n=1 Tax=Menopon gallinae TaxID=328185 RepID=A0AAW2I2X3_9NEOP
MNKYEELKSFLSKYDQDHLIRFWDELTDDEKSSLESDIRNIDFEQVTNFLSQLKETQASQEKLDSELRPVPPEIYGSVEGTNEKVLEAYRYEGLKQIAKGHVGVILLAGGQGTRLGVNDPKGMFNVGLPSGSTLFQIQAERIKRLQHLAEIEFKKRCNITWYIMTSDATLEKTQNFFKKNNYFGLDESNVVMFEQGKLPCFDFDGKILLDKKFKISMSPNGNGGLYKALRDERVLQDMDKRGVKYLHTYCVDNILVRVADPIFIGYCVSKKADCAAKVVRKDFPHEAVGVVCAVNGKYQVVEYSEITSQTAEKKNEDGTLMFNAGNICNHFFTTEFLKNVSNYFESKLKVHEARKKIPYVQPDGTRVEKPEENTGIKIEKFVFDVFPFSTNFVVWEVPREEEFSALKNGINSKKDNANTAKESIYKLHKKYIINAGGKVSGNGPCEVSPLLSYSGEGLEKICQGKKYDTDCQPVYLTPYDLQ